MDFTFLNYITVIIFGLIIGSFLNVVILRFDEIETIWSDRSHCPKCKKQLRWYDLVPVFSYVLLRAKCRYCKEPISIQYPLVEIGTALILVLLFGIYGLTVPFFFLAVISAILIVVFVYDLLHYLISDILIVIASLILVVFLSVNQWLNLISHFSFLDSIYGALICGGFFGFLVLVSKEKWMGIGDIGLGALLGALVGFPQVFVMLILAFTSGAVISLVLIIFGKKKMKGQVPFAPFLIAATWATLLFGEKLLQWYIDRII